MNNITNKYILVNQIIEELKKEYHLTYILKMDSDNRNDTYAYFTENILIDLIKNILNSEVQSKTSKIVVYVNSDYKFRGYDMEADNDTPFKNLSIEYRFDDA